LSVAYRIAGPADCEALAELGRATFIETFGHLYSRENLAAFLQNHEPGRWLADLSDPKIIVRLAEEGGRAVAYAKLGPLTVPFEPERPAIELRQFYVLGPWHGTGVADGMMRWAIAEASERADDLCLSVFVDNHRARRFYARYGFEEVGRYHFMVGTHADDELILRLLLEKE
jgi:GNAT superfamily N-acetyltransferase